MIYIYYLFAGLLLYLSYRSFLGGLKYISHFKSELSVPPGSSSMKASIFVPCRGIEKGLAENLTALLEQDHPENEVIFVVDDRDDPSVPVILNVMDGVSRSSKLVIAPAAVDSSQKVENLREAVLHAALDSEVFAFADSDMRPPPNWLSSLIAALRDEKVGASTGYRWFFSERPSIASELRSAWNASIASALGPDRNSNFCWGGSMAIRKATFERLEIRKRWKGTLSDDFALTRALKAAGLEIHFVPAALVPSKGDCSFAELFEFTNRQMKITRTNAPDLWALSLLGASLFNIVMLASVAIVVIRPFATVEWVVGAITIALVSIFSIGKSLVRIAAVRMSLPEFRPELIRQSISHGVLWVLTPAIFLINSLAALISRRIQWRGIEYEMISSNNTRLIRHSESVVE